MVDPDNPLPRPAAPFADAPQRSSADGGAHGEPTSADHERWANGVREIAAAAAIALAFVAWLAVGGLALLLLEGRGEPEGTTGFVVAVLMPFVLVPALGLTSLAAQLGRTRWRGWIAPTVAVVAGLAALVVLAGWWSLVDLLS